MMVWVWRRYDGGVVMGNLAILLQTVRWKGNIQQC